MSYFIFKTYFSAVKMLKDNSNHIEIVVNQTNCNDWHELIPFRQANSKISEYPIISLPTIARDAAYAIAEYVQAPIGMTAQSVIGAMAHIAQIYVNTPHPNDSEISEPCSLYLLSEGQSGSRKSSSRNLANRMINRYEREKYEEYIRVLEQWKSSSLQVEKKGKNPYMETTSPAPQDPSCVFTDITLESLLGLYVDGVVKNASISSDEASQFFSGHTMKADTRNQAIGTFAKLFDDGSVERMRSKSNVNGSGRAFDVRLTFNLQGQHEILADALNDQTLRGQGFLPRFILTIPENLAGTRLQDKAYRTKDVNSDERLITFWNRCKYLLEEYPLAQIVHKKENMRYVIQMSADAEQIDQDFYNEIERLQANGQIYEYLQAFASRASQLARRLATVFAFFEGKNVIDGEILTGATEIIRHSLNEWVRYTEIETVKERNAEKLIKNIIDKCMKAKTNRILKTLALKGAPSNLRKVKEFDYYMNELIELNYIRLVKINKSSYIELNPSLLNF
ncbi:DUF3987 domain-containing protein [Acinetobacter baumannii]|nr:DUF3987 domain-containing protein [Acinetobacter baumannii]EKU7083137.1 DUF3987 domain-containing protein [Acinetobacter baumannii]EKV1040565.1 DUF3987 domain-containing protein [Acinetobacter baumannii]EKV1044294.1 DUF3987 domain-containing protein [Acinetobacter baumannii]EKV1917754.1 DUF3987 domain-containing protein [Acinetobacter baumannii]